MSTSIRLSLSGKKNQPVYRIVVSETRYKRDGKHLDVLGTYNPSFKPPRLDLSQEKLEKWMEKGAIISEGLRKILPASPNRGEKKE